MLFAMELFIDTFYRFKEVPYISSIFTRSSITNNS